MTDELSLLIVTQGKTIEKIVDGRNKPFKNTCKKPERGNERNSRKMRTV